MSSEFYEFPIHVYNQTESEITNKKDLFPSKTRVKISEIEFYYWSPIDELTCIHFKSGESIEVNVKFDDVTRIVEGKEVDSSADNCESCNAGIYTQSDTLLTCNVCGFQKEVD